MKTLLICLILLIFPINIFGQCPPKNTTTKTFPFSSCTYIPMLNETILNIWPDMPMPYMFAAQIEQETCASYTHSKCWNPKAELKTSREYGVGLGQITQAYKADGSIRFDNFQEMKKWDKRLSGWKWEDRYDPKRQLHALVMSDKYYYDRVKFLADEEIDRLSFVLNSYNGGIGGLLQDRKLTQSRGFNPKVWKDNVEINSNKSRVKWKGYGASAFEISRDYVKNILTIRYKKYTDLVIVKKNIVKDLITDFLKGK